MVIPPHTIAADPTTTTNFKLFLGGWMSLRHLDKFPELNLEIALAEVWLLEESKENNFARRAWRVAIMLLYETCLVISCPLIVVSCLVEIHSLVSKPYLLKKIFPIFHWQSDIFHCNLIGPLSIRNQSDCSGTLGYFQTDNLTNQT